MTSTRLGASELRKIAARASTGAHDLGIVLAIASDIGAGSAEIARIENRLNLALQEENGAWQAVTDAEEREFEEYMDWRRGHDQLDPEEDEPCDHGLACLTHGCRDIVDPQAF